MAGAKGIAECAGESGENIAAFVRNSFETRELTLYDGTNVTVAESRSVLGA